MQYQQLSASAQSSLQSFTTIMTQEPLGRWAALRQIVNHSNNWSVAYGGEIHNNHMNLSLDYQTTYSLFQQGQSQFYQGAVVEGDVNLPGRAKLFMSTNVTPDGRFLYSWGVRTSFVGHYGGGMTVASDEDQPPAMPRYVVWGKIVDEAAGTPIADFPVEIGSETVFSNENGEFSFRLFSGREVAASPDTKTPHQGYEYELVDGPRRFAPRRTGHRNSTYGK